MPLRTKGSAHRTRSTPATKPIDSGFLYDLPSVGSPAIDPAGQSIAYVRGDTSRDTKQRSSHIELIPFAGGPARSLTTGPRDSAPAWAPDGHTLAFLRATELPGADPEPAQVWLLPLDGGEPRQLTHLPLGVRSLAWSPDGATICVVAEVDPDHDPDWDASIPRVKVVNNLYSRGDSLGWRGDARWHLFRVDVATGATTQLTRGDHNNVGPAFSPNGKTIAFTSTRSRNRHHLLPMGYELCTISSQGGAVRRLTPDVWNTTCVGWSPDGKRLAVVLDEMDDRNQPYLYAVDLSTGARTRLSNDSVTPQNGFFPIVPPSPLSWVGNRILFAADAKGSSGLYRVTLNRRLASIRQRKELIGGLSVSADGQRLAMITTTPTQPGEITSLDLNTNKTKRLTHVSRAYVRAHPPGNVERFTIKRAGHTIDCWLMFPPNFNPKRRYPLILEIHGGPNGAFGTGFSALHQVIAGAGYLVLFVNPRGSSTYGADFTDAVTEDWGGEDYQDLLAALDQACLRPYVNDKRLGVHGYSYGGYMSTWIIGHDDRFKAAAVGAPVVNLQSMYGTSDISVPWGSYQWGGRPQDNAEEYRDRSPLTHAHKVKTPVLLLHGEADHRCPISQSEEYYVALKERRKTVEFVRFPGCSHLFLRLGHPELQREYYDRVLAWFKRWL
ncbi:MAG TPA: S9 family peptidase [Dehalococcoidia bacterium]|nr:S9 family peptidase [Dehalococcoidia bacterium]